MEKICLTLVFSIQKLRHYLLYHQITIVSRANPLRYILSKPLLSGRLAKWALLLAPFDIKFIPQKAVKGQVIVDVLAAHLYSDNEELLHDLLDDELMHVKINHGTYILIGQQGVRELDQGLCLSHHHEDLSLIHSLSTRHVQIMWLNEALIIGP